MNKVQTVAYVEDFSIDLSNADAFECRGVKVDNKVLRSFNDCEVLDEKVQYLGLAGTNGTNLFLYSGKNYRMFDGKAFKNLMMKMPLSGKASVDGRYDIYRDRAYMAFDDDGVLVYDESFTPMPVARWAFRDSAKDIAVVNERLVILTDDGVNLRFSECGKRLYSDDEIAGYTVPAIALPSAVQAICRFSNNVLYALGNVCYKLTFSADEQDIKVVTIADGIGEVVTHSVARLADKVVFATVNGLRVLRNDKVTPIFSELSNAVSSFQDCKASAWRGNYVLTIPRGQGRCGYVLDVDHNKCVALLNNDVSEICVYDGRDYAVTADGKLIRYVDGAYAGGIFVRSRVDFGNSRRKYLRRLNVATKYDVEVIVTDEYGVARSYRVKGSDKRQSIRVYGAGRAFGLQVRSFGATEVTELTLTAETYKEDYYGN